MPKTRFGSDHLQAGIVISYRTEGKEPGKAAFFDAYTFASHSGFKVCFAASSHPDVKQKHLADYIQTQTFNIPNALVDATIRRPLPVFVANPNAGGLLILPGMTRDSYEKNPSLHQHRMAFETGLLKESLRRGRPILAVCAGSWTLWEALGGSITKVEHHNYTTMPRINAKGKMTYNVHVHDIVVQDDSLLADALDLDSGKRGRSLPVNSIHWMAPTRSKIPAGFQVAATAKTNPSVDLKTRQSTPMTPVQDTVEAFSSTTGAPVFGIQWHPEAFDFNKKSGADAQNTSAIVFMAKAGTAYKCKQEMLGEFKDMTAKAKGPDPDSLANVFKKLAI